MNEFAQVIGRPERVDDRLELPADTTALEAAIAELPAEEQALVRELQALSG